MISEISNVLEPSVLGHARRTRARQFDVPPGLFPPFAAGTGPCVNSVMRSWAGELSQAWTEITADLCIPNALAHRFSLACLKKGRSEQSSLRFRSDESDLVVAALTLSIVTVSRASKPSKS